MERDALPLEKLADLNGVRELIGERADGGVAGRIAAAAAVLESGANSKAAAVAAVVPSRIEVLGKHTDYAGGHSLTCAVERTFTMVAVKTDEEGVRITDQLFDEQVFLPYGAGSRPAGPAWTAYPHAVVWRAVHNLGRPDTGLSIAFTSDIPRASGLSSSTAFVTGVWLCLAALTEVCGSDAFTAQIRSPADVASWLACIENGSDFRGLTGTRGIGTKGIGTQGGAQDHAAVLYSEKNRLGHFAYRPLRRLGRQDIPPDLRFVVASSGVRAHKGGDAQEAYNSAVRLSREAVRLWSRTTGQSFESLQEVVEDPGFSLEAFESAAGASASGGGAAPSITARVRQFVEETGRVIPGFIEALERRDYDSLSRSVSQSQEMADRLLGNQVPETRFLASSALEVGAVAASAFGAGFGGSVWALVPEDESTAFLGRWLAAYGSRFPVRLRRACFFEATPCDGAFVIGASPAALLIEPKL